MAETLNRAELNAVGIVENQYSGERFGLEIAEVMSLTGASCATYRLINVYRKHIIWLRVQGLNGQAY